jgi:hypothetical protein
LKECTIEGCSKELRALGLCRTHYNQQWNKNHKTSEKDRERWRDHSRKYRAENPEKVRESHRKSSRKQYAHNLAREQERARKYRADNLEKVRKSTRESARERSIFSNYRLSNEEWIQIYEHQKGLCPMCGSQLKNRCDEASIGKAAALDHDHATGLVRGLLCQMPCNGALGAFRDKTQWLRNALAYIDSPPATSAFSKPMFTLPGRIGTKKRRALWKKHAAIVDKIKEIGLVTALGAHLQFVDDKDQK